MELSQYTIMHEVEETHFWFAVMGKISQFLLHSYMSKKKQQKILDAGCGTGGALLFLKNYGRTYGIDISPYAINLCKKRGFKNTHVGSIERMSYSSDFFDVVTCFDVLYHKKVINDKKALSELRRVLKSGGLLLIRVAAYEWLRGQHDRSVHTKHRYTAGELKKLLHECGFEVLRLTYANSILLPSIIIKRLAERIFPQKSRAHSDVRSLSPFLNRFFKFILLCEYHLLKYISFPFGLSVIAVARKK